MTRKSVFLSLLLCVCVSIVLVLWQKGSGSAEIIPNAEALTGGWKHCLCYDIKKPVEAEGRIWHCKDGFFVTSITQKPANRDPGSGDVAPITEIQCCSLCY